MYELVPCTSEYQSLCRVGANPEVLNLVPVPSPGSVPCTVGPNLVLRYHNRHFIIVPGGQSRSALSLVKKHAVFTSISVISDVGCVSRALSACVDSKAQDQAGSSNAARREPGPTATVRLQANLRAMAREAEEIMAATAVELLH
eukprot:SAG31_NODE_582_length_13925_cov_32.209967_10_plen_144_part_00